MRVFTDQICIQFIQYNLFIVFYFSTIFALDTNFTASKTIIFLDTLSFRLIFNTGSYSSFSVLKITRHQLSESTLNAEFRIWRFKPFIHVTYVLNRYHTAFLCPQSNFIRLIAGVVSLNSVGVFKFWTRLCSVNGCPP